jgi:hypothetical protein
MDIFGQCKTQAFAGLGADSRSGPLLDWGTRIKCIGDRAAAGIKSCLKTCSVLPGQSLVIGGAVSTDSRMR